MELAEAMKELESMGSEQCRKTYANHGAPENMFGVRVGDMKKLQKKTKVDHKLALELFATGNPDAQYFAGMIADPGAATKKDLDAWAKSATWYMVSEHAVAGVAADSPHGWVLGLKWIDAKKEHVAACGWATLGACLSVKPEDEIDADAVAALLERVEKRIHDEPNRVRYAMNGFVITAGGQVPSLTKKAKAAAKRIGKVQVDMGGTACKVPEAVSYIEKIEKMGHVGKKRKTARC